MQQRTSHRLFKTLVRFWSHTHTHTGNDNIIIKKAKTEKLLNTSEKQYNISKY